MGGSETETSSPCENLRIRDIKFKLKVVAEQAKSETVATNSMHATLAATQPLTWRFQGSGESYTHNRCTPYMYMSVQELEE